MGISDWFTIFGLFLAVYALFSSEERRIITLKLNPVDPYILAGTILGTLFLIKYDDLSARFPLLNHLTVSWGFSSSNLALSFFVLASIIYSFRIFRLPDKFPSEKLTKYYLEMMKQDFKTFYRLFIKYEKNATNKKYFKKYKWLIFDPVFIDGISDQPYFYTDIIEKVDEDTFNLYFKKILTDQNSIYYKELKLNGDYRLVEESNYFLYTLLHKNPGLFFSIGGLIILKEWYLNHLEKERLKSTMSIYNQPADLSVEGFEVSLPLYLHITFIGLLYQESIIQKIDTTTLSERYINMQSIFSHLISKSIENIDLAIYCQYQNQEYPLKYHYLFGEIFSTITAWIKEFNKPEYFVENHSQLDFFPFCLHLCIAELIKGHEKQVISVEFLNSRVHYSVFALYYKHDLNEKIREQIEEKCILEIPTPLLEDILRYSLDEEYALGYDEFVEENFFHPGSSATEMVIIKRLYDLLKGKNLI